MTLASAIIAQAFREGNMVPVGSVPSAAEAAEGLTRLNALLGSLFAEELGSPLRDWPVPAAWETEQEKRHPLTPVSTDVSLEPWRYPPANSRLIIKITSPVTILLPTQPADGARIAAVNVASTANPTIHANGRLIEGSPYITNTAASLHGKSWFYRADIGTWTLIAPLPNDATELPLPAEFDDLFVTGLAIRIAPRYGIELKASVLERFTDMLGRVTRRYKEGAVPKSAQELRTILRTTP